MYVSVEKYELTVDADELSALMYALRTKLTCAATIEHYAQLAERQPRPIDIGVQYGIRALRDTYNIEVSMLRTMGAYCSRADFVDDVLRDAEQKIRERALQLHADAQKLANALDAAGVSS